MLQIEELKFNFQMLKELDNFEATDKIKETIEEKTKKTILDLKEETDEDLIDYFVGVLINLYSKEEKGEKNN